MAEERHRSLDRVAQVLDRWTTQQAQQPVARLVDTRGIGRPSNFGSGEEKSLEKSFPVWQRKMQNYIISVFPDLREPLEWAAMTAVPITHQLVDRRFGSEAEVKRFRFVFLCCSCEEQDLVIRWLERKTLAA